MNKIIKHENFHVIFYFIIQIFFLASFYLSWKYSTIKEKILFIDLAINIFNLFATILLLFYHYNKDNFSSLIIKLGIFFIVLVFNIDIYIRYSKENNRTHRYFNKIFNINN